MGKQMNAQISGPGKIQEIAERAYIFGYPLVLLGATMAALPVNHLTHVSAFPDANFRLIVRPNADTLYTNAWFDVSKEPMLLHVADSGGRFLSAAIDGCMDGDLCRSRKANNRNR